MFRLTLLPFVLLFGSLFFGIMSFIIIRKLKRGIEFSLKKGAELANQQQQKWSKKWAKKEQRKKLPEILQKGFDQFDQLQISHARLPVEWREATNPLIEQAKAILSEVADDVASNDKNSNGADNGLDNKKLNIVRSFFNHTLDALLQFSEKLNENHTQMNTEQIEKARQNITIFKADLLGHQETLLKANRMDFDVLMDVIKARLKK